MKTYWDLSESQRAALTREDVEKFIGAELMLKGVLRVEPLKQEPEVAIPEPQSTYHIMRFGYRGALAFTTAEEAQKALDLHPLFLDSEYMESRNVDVVRPLRTAEDKGRVTVERVFSEDEVNAIKAQLRHALAIKADNDKRRREYDEAMKAQDEALKGMWTDWLECRKRDDEMKRVAATFNEYVTTADGDTLTAARFLAKVFTQEQITDAAQWCSIEIPLETA